MPITRTKKRIIIGAGIVLLFASFGLTLRYAIDNVLPYSPIRPHRATPEEVRALHPGLNDPSSVGLRFDTFDVDVEPTIRLKGWFVHATGDTTRGTVLLLHGIGASRYAMITFAAKLAAAGFNSVLYDSRANGESGGLNCTFGYYEKHDVQYIIDAVQQRYSQCGPIGIYGNSLGAAVSIQAMAVDERICCGVVESPFATLREVIAQFVVDSVRPEHSARSITHPVMVSHGTLDAKIDISYGRRVFAAIASSEKRFRPIERGAHNDLVAIGGAAYANEVLAFFRLHMHP